MEDLVGVGKLRVDSQSFATLVTEVAVSAGCCQLLSCFICVHGLSSANFSLFSPTQCAQKLHV